MKFTQASKPRTWMEAIIRLFSGPHTYRVAGKFHGVVPPSNTRFLMPTPTKYHKPHQSKQECARRVRQGLA